MKISKNFLIITSGLLVISFSVKAQKKKAVSKDGEVVDYEVISNDANDMNRFVVYIPAMGDEGYSLLGFSYFKPEKYFIRTNLIGPTNSIEGTLFLKNLSFYRDKEHKLIVSVKTESDVIHTGYVKESIRKRTYIGIHGGYTYKTYPSTFVKHVLADKLTAHELALGGGLITGKFIKWVVFPKGKPLVLKVTSQFGVYADVLFYPVIKYKGPEPIIDNEGKQYSSYRDLITNFGARAYIEGRFPILTGADFGFHYRLGLGFGALKGEGGMYGIGALGFYFSIKNKNSK